MSQSVSLVVNIITDMQLKQTTLCVYWPQWWSVCDWQQSYPSILCSLEDAALHVDADGTCTLIQQSIPRAGRETFTPQVERDSQMMSRSDSKTRDSLSSAQQSVNWEALPVVEHTSHPHPLLLSSRQNIFPVTDRIPACHTDKKETCWYRQPEWFSSVTTAAIISTLTTGQY